MREDEDQASPAEDAKLTLRERARLARRAAYQKAKAGAKERAKSPQAVKRAEELKVRMKERRRAAYQKAKDAHKDREAVRRADEKKRQEQEAEEASALRQAELLSLLKKGTELESGAEQPRRPRLRLIKND